MYEDHPRGLMSVSSWGIAALGLTIVLCLVAAPALAATTGGNGAHPDATPKVVAHLKSGTKLQIALTIDGIAFTTSCTSFSASGFAPAKGSTLTLSAAPAITTCTDSVGGTDTVGTNVLDGKWKFAESVVAGKPEMGLVLPKSGMTLSSSLLSSCTISFAPSASGSLTGSWKATANWTGTTTIVSAPLPISASGGCTASSTATVSATVYLSEGK